MCEVKVGDFGGFGSKGNPASYTDSMCEHVLVFSLVAMGYLNDGKAPDPHQAPHHPLNIHTPRVHSSVE